LRLNVTCMPHKCKLLTHSVECPVMILRMPLYVWVATCTFRSTVWSIVVDKSLLTLLISISVLCGYSKSIVVTIKVVTWWRYLSYIWHQSLWKSFSSFFCLIRSPDGVCHAYNKRWAFHCLFSAEIWKIVLFGIRSATSHLRQNM